MSDDTTIAVYDSKAGAFEEMAEELDCLSQVQAFADALPNGGRVLDLGCGPGIYAGWLAKAGFKVDATDASIEMVKLAVQHPGVTAWQADFSDIPETAIYDGIWANFSLLHAKRADFPHHLAQLKKAGKPGCILHLAMKIGTGEDADSLGRYYAYYGEEELVLLLAKAGFTTTKRQLGEGSGLTGTVESWISVQAYG